MTLPLLNPSRCPSCTALCEPWQPEEYARTEYSAPRWACLRCRQEWSDAEVVRWREGATR